MEQYYVGLDVHSRESTFVIEDAAGHLSDPAPARTRGRQSSLQTGPTSHRRLPRRATDGCDRESLERYAASGDWVMLFNALALMASPSPGAIC
jgi:hypothetical protein